MENTRKTLVDSYREEIIKKVPEIKERTLQASDQVIEIAYKMMQLSEKDRNIFANYLINR